MKTIEELSADLPAVFSAVRQVVSAISRDAIAECFSWSLLGAELLKEQGYLSEAVAGVAGWRVGNGDGDVIFHAPIAGVKLYASTHNALPAHAWIRISIQDTMLVLVDFTTHLLPAKAAQLDAMDKQKTTVKWAPQYLCASLLEVKTTAGIGCGTAGSLADVVNASSVGPLGMYYYERLDEVEKLMRKARHQSDLDTWLQAAALVLDANRDNRHLHVIGI